MVTYLIAAYWRSDYFLVWISNVQPPRVNQVNPLGSRVFRLYLVIATFIIIIEL